MALNLRLSQKCTFCKFLIQSPKFVSSNDSFFNFFRIGEELLHNRGEAFVLQRTINNFQLSLNVSFIRFEEANQQVLVYNPGT